MAWSRRGVPQALTDALAVVWATYVVTVSLVAGTLAWFSLVTAVAKLAVATVIASTTVLGTVVAVLCGLCA
ncbi:hypothetical protein ABFA25_13415 [Mycobacterium lepromatosis]|nr:hypothetical protein [Mycobacterium lepromatosis]